MELIIHTHYILLYKFSKDTFGIIYIECYHMTMTW